MASSKDGGVYLRLDDVVFESKILSLKMAPSEDVIVKRLRHLIRVPICLLLQITVS